MRTFCEFPPAALAPYIDRFWGWESDATETIALPIVLPGTGAELYIHYGTPFHCHSSSVRAALPHGHLLCVRRRPIHLGDTTRIGFIAARFRAGAIHCFTRTPAHDLIDNTLPLSEIWGHAGTVLADSIRTAPTLQERLRLLKTFLIDRVHCTDAHQLTLRATTLIYRDSAFITIAQVARQLGITTRQLERKMLQITGLSPVELKQLSRFQRTTKSLLLDPRENAVEAALAHGYYDQSHFIREFRSMTSESPHLFIKQARTRSHFYNTSRPHSEKL